MHLQMAFNEHAHIVMKKQKEEESTKLAMVLLPTSGRWIVLKYFSFFPNLVYEEGINFLNFQV
jgi:hypothetical protein